MFIFPKKERLGIWTARIIVFIPLVIWLVMKPVDIRFASIGAASISIGQITALLGISAFAVTLILSARIKWFEQFFGGLDKLYAVHHLLGVISFLLLLVHPLAIAVSYAQISLILAAKFLLPSSDWAINFGIFSLVLMMIVIAVTMFAKKVQYENLRNVHKTFGLIFFLGALHAFLIPSDISQNILLRVYILGLSGIAILLYTYRTILGKFLVQKYTYVVKNVTFPVEGVTEVWMKPVGKIMNYEPGQFVFISFDDVGVARGEIHPFSISSAPHEDFLKITVKSLGNFSKKISTLTVGSEAKVEGPYGHFSYLRNTNKRQIWIAGGVGVTPFINMTRDLNHNNRTDYEIDFYYSARTTDEMLQKSEFNAFSLENPNFRFIPFPGDKMGFLSAEYVAETSKGIFGKDVYICGPPTMMNSLITQFLKGGIPKKRIHTEAFRML